LSTRSESVSERQKALVRSALVGRPLTRREVAIATRSWYNDVDKAVRQMMADGEIEVVGRGGVWGGAELVALSKRDGCPQPPGFRRGDRATKVINTN